MAWYKTVLMILLPLCAMHSSISEASHFSDPEEVAMELKKHFFNAAREGDMEVLELFIESRYDLDTQDTKGYSALILATYYGHLNAVERLLTAGANPCIKDNRGNTAFMGAIFKGEEKIAYRLIGTRCNVDERNNAGQTAAMYAALFERVELLQAMKDWGADLNAQDAAGNSAAQILRGGIRLTSPIDYDHSR